MAEATGVSSVGCTVVDRGGLAAGLVLAGSYLSHHPGHDFLVLITDEPGAERPEDHTRLGGAATIPPGCRLVGYRWLGLDEDDYLRLATCATAAELVAALRPVLVGRLLSEYDVVLSLPAQSLVLAPLAECAHAAADTGLVLGPLVLDPLPADGLEPDGSGGGLDPDFAAVGRAAKPFVDYWTERARTRLLRTRSAAEEAAAGTEPNWLAEVPALFRVSVLRDPGFGLSYWNLHERELTRAADGTLTAAGSTVRWVNFGGYDPQQPWLLSTYCADRPRVRLSDQPALRTLCDSYRSQLLATAEQAGEPGPYRFDRTANGLPITPLMRGVFRAAWRESQLANTDQAPLGRAGETLPAHPFGADRGTGFIAWLSAPASFGQRTAGMNRLAMWLWAQRVDLQVAFPDPLYRSAADYRAWCRTHGAAGGLLPASMMPTEPVTPADPVAEFGVNLAGYLTAELGLGELSRILHTVIERADIPVVSVVEDGSLTGLVRTALAEPNTTGRPRFPVSILSVNSDYTALVLATHPEIGHRRYRIGVWAWELEEFPTELRQAFDLVDEVWTISEFSRAAIAAHATVPVKVFPVPVIDPGPVARPAKRPGEPTRFLFAFDFNSTGQRKNPWGLVTAFRRAFGDRDDVRLVIKATNGRLHAAAAERLRYLVGDDPRIELMERYLSVAELSELYASCDAYVSLHRSEGFGLTVAEAMIRGIPVISTDYSSTTEFVDDTVGWPIPYTTTEVGEGWTPYPATATWAQPDLDAAAEAMRTVADDPAEARRRGTAARQHLLRSQSMASAVAWTREQLMNAYRSWQERDPDALDLPETPPMERVRQVVHAEPDTQLPHRIPFAPTMRRMVRRAISHYDAQQREVHAALVDGVREEISLVEQRIDNSASTQLCQLTATERALAGRIAALADRLTALEAREAREETIEAPRSDATATETDRAGR